MTDAALPTSSAPAPAIPRRAWQALIVLLAAMFIALLDTTIVNVALPSIRTSIDASEATLSWIISGYALAFGLALIPAGRIGDRIGHKWVFFTGLALFTVSSLACGLSQNDVQLVMSRVVQGLAGGMFVPAVTAYIQLLFPFRSRGKAFAIMGAVIGVSSALGPIVGGLIIEAFGAENGWRLVFGVNLPIGVATLIAAAILLPGHRESDAISTSINGPTSSASPVKAGIDWLGLVLVSAGLVALLVPLIQGEDEGWPLWTFLSIAGGALLIVAFGAWEVAYSKRGRSPGAPATFPPPLLHRRRHPGSGVLRGLHEHLLHHLDPLAGRTRPHRTRVGSGLDPLRDRLDRRLLAERSAGAASRPHRARHRHRGRHRGSRVGVAGAPAHRSL